MFAKFIKKLTYKILYLISTFKFWTVEYNSIFLLELRVRLPGWVSGGDSIRLRVRWGYFMASGRQLCRPSRKFDFEQRTSSVFLKIVSRLLFTLIFLPKYKNEEKLTANFHQCRSWNCPRFYMASFSSHCSMNETIRQNGGEESSQKADHWYLWEYQSIQESFL